MTTVARLLAWIAAHHRWFALGAFFSLFSLVALVTGDVRWLSFLGYLGFLGFLAMPNPQASMVEPCSPTAPNP